MAATNDTEQDVTQTLKRIETRLCVLMQHLGISPQGKALRLDQISPVQTHPVQQPSFTDQK